MGLAYFKHAHRLLCLPAILLEILIFRPFRACTVLRGCQIDPKHKSKAFCVKQRIKTRGKKAAGEGGNKYIAAGFLKSPAKLAAARQHVELCELS